MRYIALMRGINVGGNHRVDMKELKVLFEALGFTGVSTYINSGNVIFSSADKQENALEKIETCFSENFDFEIPVIVRSEKEMKKIASAVPESWLNDGEQRTDVAFLFPEADHEKIIDELPLKRDFIDVRYVRGAVFWNARRENVSKSNLAKLIGHKTYKLMTIRNINTARFLAGE